MRKPNSHKVGKNRCILNVMTLLFAFVLHFLPAQGQNAGLISSANSEYVNSPQWRAAKVFRWERYNGKPELLVQEAKQANINLLSLMETYFTQGQPENEQLIELANREGIKVLVIFQTFYNDHVEIDSTLSALDVQGKPVSEQWLTFICPNHEDYKKQRLQQIEEVVRRYKPHGISLDFFRYFVYWEAGADTRLVQTCFCKRCLIKFEMQHSIDVPATQIIAQYIHEWTQFKCNTISEYAERIHHRVKSINPDIILNLHTVPWIDSDFGGAIKSIAAQDLTALAPYFDFFQPMTYSGMLKQSVEWTHAVGTHMQQKLPQRTVIPCIEAAHAHPDSLAQITRTPVRGYSIWPFEKYASGYRL